MKVITKKHISFFLATILSVILFAKSFANEAQYYTAFARFIKLIYQNTESANMSDKFCVFGYDDVSIRFSSIIDKKQLIFLPEDLDENKSYSQCRVIYYAKSKMRVTKYSMNILNKSKSLTVAIFNDFVSDGGMIFVDVGRRNFELIVNSDIFKKSKVRLDSSITGLIVEKR